MRIESRRLLRHIPFMSFALLLAIPCPAFADALARIKDDGTIRLAVRADAPPFSSMDASGKPSGYSVALCEAVAANLKEQLKLPTLKTAFVTVTSEDRFDAIKDGKADILCEATTATLKRREVVDFSIPTFVSGASLAIRPGGPSDLGALAGLKVGVLAGTTTEEGLRITLAEKGIAADIVPAHSHDDGIAALEKGDVAAYFADRTILRALLSARKSPAGLLLAENYLTVEPYALAVPLGESGLRLAVDRALSQLYRTGTIAQLFKKSFGANAKPTALQKALYTISGLPE